jgi:hypothetical protein
MNFKFIMKKRWLLFLILGLLLVSLVHAQDDTDLIDVNKTSDPNITSGLSDVENKTNAALGGEVEIPPGLQLIARVLFGVKEPIALNIFIILICVWIALFVIIANAVIFISGKKWMCWVGSFIIMCLIGVGGGLREISFFVFDFWNFLDFLEKNPILKLILSVVIAAIFLFGGLAIVKMLGKNANEEIAENTGFQAGAGAKILKEESKIYKNKYG